MKNTVPLLHETRQRSASTSASVASTIFSASNNDIESTPTSFYSTLVVCCAAIGGLLFGYDTGVISGVLVTIRDDLEGEFLTAFQQELITSITSVGALLGCLIAGTAADRLGRRTIISLCCVVFVIASIQMCFSYSVSQLVFGRFVVGLAVGGASMIVPVYIAEIAPAQKRGRLLTVNSLATTGGQLLAYVIAMLIRNSKYNWRLMFLISGIPPIMFLGFVGFIPESPRFLILAGDIKESYNALQKLYPAATESQIHDKITSIQTDLYENRKLIRSSLKKRMFGLQSTVRALIVVCSLMIFQQLCGFNALMYYSGIIFSKLGLKNPLLFAILIAFTNFLFTFVATFFVDKLGRRKILLCTVWVMSVAMFVCSMCFKSLVLDAPGGVTRVAEEQSNTVLIILIGSITTYVASYASALGTVPWSAAEILPIEARAPGSTLVAMCNWSTNIVVSMSYLTLMNKIGAWGVFLIDSLICLIGWVGIYLIFPEVAGIPLETVKIIFRDGFGVEFANEIREELQRLRPLSSDTSDRDSIA